MFATLLAILSSIFNFNRIRYGREYLILRHIFYKIKRLFSKPPVFVHTTKLGKIKGNIEESKHVGKYFSFEGVPFAKPPIGKLRFKAPQPMGPWQDIVDATKPAKKSLQPHILLSFKEGDEDCLYLNIFTKELKSGNNALKPVMAYIHGGGFVYMTGMRELQGPDFLLNEDVVVVHINYRLGVLGFLSIPDPSLDVAGNAAFKDMVLALKWIQDNITDYNGDPNNITIFGESAGAVSTHLLMLSPLAKGLFHKVICQSGSSLCCWGKGDPNVAQKLAKATGCESTDQKTILSHLQNLSDSDIFKGQMKLHKDEIFASVQRYAGWVIEPPSKEAFLSRDPLDILLTGDYHHVPIIMGFHSNEGMLFETIMEDVKKPNYHKDPENHVPCLLYMTPGSDHSKKIGQDVLKFYLGEPPYSYKNNRLQLYTLLGDTCFTWAICTSVKNHAKTSSEPVYFYQFSFDGRINIVKKVANISEPGSCHGDETLYIFSPEGRLNLPPDCNEEITRRRFCKMWTNFAKCGNPTPTIDKLLPITWTPSTTSLNYLNIDKELTIQSNPFPARMKFLDQIFQLNSSREKLF